MVEFGETCEEVPPDQAKEKAVQDYLLSWTPCMLLECQAERYAVVTTNGGVPRKSALPSFSSS